MAISTGSRISISLSQVSAGQVQMNVWDYVVLELVGTPTAGNYAEAWWNHVKDDYRAIALAAWGSTFTAVKVTELGNPTGDYGEYAIPAGERAGTRTSPTDADAMPSYTAAGVRLGVSTRATRPGQKRIGFLTQSDVLGNDLQAGFNALLVTLMDTMKTNMTLGSPAAATVLVPSVVSLNADGTIRTSQVITGYAINQHVTSQVSRRYGRGV
uniref:Uncharacterized protein n=1 Tax=uncultured prokaryote TaxID=198431 RepID=A0A0H5Q1G2_9ZZZZ|nr:hypothetical protein [uncultured prokaryote]